MRASGALAVTARTTASPSAMFRLSCVRARMSKPALPPRATSSCPTWPPAPVMISRARPSFCVMSVGTCSKAEALAAIGAGTHPLPPLSIVEIPLDGFAQAGVETFARLPAKLAPDLGRIYRVARVMAGAVCDKGDEIGVRPVGRMRQQLVQKGA